MLGVISAAWGAADYTPKYRLIDNPEFPTNDLAVATYNLMDYGVDNTGEKDCTQTINTLLKKLNGVTGSNSIGDYRHITGGVLYIPEGRYLVTGKIEIPRGVTVRGDWRRPDGTIRGTILMIRPGKNVAGTTYETNSAVVMQPTSEISNITFWYPDQDVSSVTAYPPTVLYGYQGYWGNDYCNVRHCTFVNSYTAIKFSTYNGGGCPNVFDVYGTPLSEGVVMDNIADVGRFDGIHFSPKYWAESGLDGAPAENTVRAYTRANATGIVMRRNDWSYTCNYDADGYNVGFHADASVASPGSSPNGHNYAFNLTDCATGILISNSSSSGIMFTRVSTSRCGIGVRTTGGDGAVQLLGCRIQAGISIYNEMTAGVGMMLQECTVSGRADIMGAQLTSVNSTYDSEVTIGPMARSIFTGNTFTGSGRLTNKSIYKCQYSETPVAVKPLPEYRAEWMEIKETRPARAALYVVTDAEFGARPVDILTSLAGQPDNSAAIQAALDKAGSEGGGIVYLPAGHYRMDRGLRIPRGVELKGAGDIASVPKGNGAILEVYGVSEGNENADAFVMMDEGSGMRGVHFNYPNQTDIRNIKKYPYTIRGNKDCYIVNVAARAAYRVLDLFTNKCDNHYVDYLAGHAYMNVIRLGGGSANGIISNIQFNTIAYACGDETKFGAWPNSVECRKAVANNKVYGQNYEHLDFFIIGDCTDEVLYNNFLFGCHDGMRFQKDNGRGAVNVRALGNAVDGAVNTVVVNGLGSDLDLINSQIVALNHDNQGDILDFALEAYFFSTAAELDKTVNLFASNLWGGGNYMCNVQGGTVNMYLPYMSASGAKYTFNVAAKAAMNVVGGYIQNVRKITQNTTSTSHTAMRSTVFDPTGKTGSWAADDNNLAVAWEMTNTKDMLPRTGWKASSNKNNGNARNAIDGRASTRWDTSASQSSSADTWLCIDMGKNCTFNTIILNSAGSPDDGPAAYKAEIYQNGAWREIASGTNGGAMTVITSDESLTASQVRVTLLKNPKGNYWSVHEFYLASLDLTTAIGDVTGDTAVMPADAVAEVYTPAGVRVAAFAAAESVPQSLASGIYIIRYKAGGRVIKTEKTVIKK